jgi:glycerate 2-kinase
LIPFPSPRERLRSDALNILSAALDASSAGNAIRSQLVVRDNHLVAADSRVPLADFDRIFLIAVGKAAVPMAAATQEVLGSLLTDSLVITKQGHVTEELSNCRIVEAGHPIPDENSLRAARLILDSLDEMKERDLILLAVSGGASALLSAPLDPITLADKQETTDLLLRAGADIFELNAVRKHLSFLKGGRLAAAAYPATVVGLILSDVIGDPLDVIGSGLTAPDTSTFADALVILTRFGLLERVPPGVREILEAGAAAHLPETPKPGDPVFANVRNVVVGSNRLALMAGAKAAEALGYRTLILSSSMQGEARYVARVHAEILREVVTSGNPLRRPACILSGGETIVTVRGGGKGGRNQEFALAAALGIAGLQDVLILSAGTDGSDGPTDAAGAIARGDTLARAIAASVDGPDCLLRNDSYSFFDALGDLVKTGPTGTNVMDVHIMLAQRS